MDIVEKYNLKEGDWIKTNYVGMSNLLSSPILFKILNIDSGTIKLGHNNNNSNICFNKHSRYDRLRLSSTGIFLYYENYTRIISEEMKKELGKHLQIRKIKYPQLILKKERKAEQLYLNKKAYESQ